MQRRRFISFIRNGLHVSWPLFALEHEHDFFFLTTSPKREKLPLSEETALVCTIVYTHTMVVQTLKEAKTQTNQWDDYTLRRHQAMTEARRMYHSSHHNMIQRLPDAIKLKFGDIGYGLFYDRWYPVVLVSPLDMGSNNNNSNNVAARNEWQQSLDEYCRGHDEMKHLGFWIAANAECSLLRPSEFVPVEQATSLQTCEYDKLSIALQSGGYQIQKGSSDEYLLDAIQQMKALVQLHPEQRRQQIRDAMIMGSSNSSGLDTSQSSTRDYDLATWLKLCETPKQLLQLVPQSKTNNENKVNDNSDNMVVAAPQEEQQRPRKRPAPDENDNGVVTAARAPSRILPKYPKKAPVINTSEPPATRTTQIVHPSNLGGKKHTTPPPPPTTTTTPHRTTIVTTQKAPVVTVNPPPPPRTNQVAIPTQQGRKKGVTPAAAKKVSKTRQQVEESFLNSEKAILKTVESLRAINSKKGTDETIQQLERLNSHVPYMCWQFIAHYKLGYAIKPAKALLKNRGKSIRIYTKLKQAIRARYEESREEYPHELDLDLLRKRRHAGKAATQRTHVQGVKFFLVCFCFLMVTIHGSKNNNNNWTWYED